MKDNGGKLVKEKCIMTKRPNGRILIDWEEEEEEEESEEEESEEVRQFMTFDGTDTLFFSMLNSILPRRIQLQKAWR